MNRKELEKIINESNDAFFVGKLSQSQISNAEKLLGTKFPESYKWFLSNYGTGGLYGREILGGGLQEIPTCVQSTLFWRNYGLPPKMIVVEDLGEWLFCIDTENMINDESPIIDWEQNIGKGKKFYDDFYEYLFERFTN